MSGARRRGGPALAVALAALCAAAVLCTGTAAAAGSAAAYCRSKGGIVQGQAGGGGTPAGVCLFHGAGPDDDILVGLRTLDARRPTLATVAYLGRQTMTTTNPGVYLPPIYCAQVGGVVPATGNPYDMCVFRDGSRIDVRGLWAHAVGGFPLRNLTRLFRSWPRHAAG
jgi:putative hemolysin